MWLKEVTYPNILIDFKINLKSGDGVTVAKGKMNLQQSINFLSQSHEAVTASRKRLDQAVRSLAEFISEKGLPGERVTVNGAIYEVAEMSSNIGHYKYLAVCEDYEKDFYGDRRLKSLEEFENFNLHGDINSRILASGRVERLEFAMNCIEIVKAFGELWQHKAARFNAGAIIAEQINANN